MCSFEDIHELDPIFRPANQDIFSKKMCLTLYTKCKQYTDPPRGCQAVAAVSNWHCLHANSYNCSRNVLVVYWALSGRVRSTIWKRQIGRIDPVLASCISNVVNVGQYLFSFGPMLRVFLANDTWYPCLCEQMSHMNRRPAALWRIERGVTVSAPPPLFGTYPKQKHDHIKLLGQNIYNSPLWGVIIKNKFGEQYPPRAQPAVGL